MTAAQLITDALATLCRLSGADPADDSAAAGRAVAAVLAERGGESACPVDGPLSRWLRGACMELLMAHNEALRLRDEPPERPVEHRALILETRVLLRYGTGDAAPCEFVDLPGPVRVALELGDRWRLDPGHGKPGDNRPRLRLNCPGCGTERKILVPDCAQALSDARARLCKSCGEKNKRRAA